MGYKVIGKFMGCTDIIGIKLKDLSNEQTLKVRYKEFEELVRNKEVIDAEIVDIDNKEYIIGIGLSEIEKQGLKGNFNVCDRIINEDGTVIGYKIIESTTYKIENIDIKTAWQLAFNGSLKGVRALYNRDSNKINKMLIVDDMVEA